MPMRGVGRQWAKMKKVILMTVSIIAVLLCVSSCNNSKIDKLKKDIEAANKMCPVSFGASGELKNITFDEDTKTVKMHYTLRDMFFDVVNNSPELATKTMKLKLFDDNFRPILEQIVSANCNFECIYQTYMSGKTFSIKLTTDELKEIISTPMSSEERNMIILKNRIEMENAVCPVKMGNGLEVVSAVIDNDRVVYRYKVDESIDDLSMFYTNEDNIKASMYEMFQSESYQNSTKLFIELNMSLVYQFCGDSEVVEITFSPEELRYLMP